MSSASSHTGDSCLTETSNLIARRLCALSRPPTLSNGHGNHSTPDSDLFAILKDEWVRASFSAKVVKLGSDLVLCIFYFVSIHDATYRGIVQAHGLADVREAIAVIHVRLAMNLVTSSPVGSTTGAEQLS